MKNKFQCKVCGYEWVSRNPRKSSKNIGLPATCANQKCKSTLWEKGYNQECEICGRISLVPILHHKDKNHHNNASSNRSILCRSCHVEIHAPSNKVHKGRRKKIRNYYQGKNSKFDSSRKIDNSKLQSNFLILKKIKEFRNYLK
ncbi:MAG: hypothetical protein PHS54_01395 [Clostridia bacterium]|nr:hypothetical protein [Clostridia bacterium]